MLKRICAFVTSAIMIAVMIPVAAADAPVTVLVNGQKIKFDVEPVITDGRTLVPLRAICDAIGAEIYYEVIRDVQTVSVIKGDTLVTLVHGILGKNIGLDSSWQIYKHTIPKNFAQYASGYNDDLDNEKTMEVQPQIVNGRTMVPVRVLTEYLGARVDWINETRTVDIKVSDTSFNSGYTRRMQQNSDFTVEKADEIFYQYCDETGASWMSAMECDYAFTSEGRVCVYLAPNKRFEYHVYANPMVKTVDRQLNQVIDSRPVGRIDKWKPYRKVWCFTKNDGTPYFEIVIRGISNNGAIEYDLYFADGTKLEHMVGGIDEDGRVLVMVMNSKKEFLLKGYIIIGEHFVSIDVEESTHLAKGIHNAGGSLEYSPLTNTYPLIESCCLKK